jgi:hypothetical protein
MLLMHSVFFLIPEVSGQAKIVHVSTLEVVNSFPGEWCCASDGYLYGTNRRNVLRKAEHGQDVDVRGDVRSIDPSFIIENRIYSTSVPGLIFILVKNNLDNHFLLRSSNGGSTFSLSYTFGEGNGPGNTNTVNVRLLRELLELKRNLPGGTGRGWLYIGEYNVNRNRIPGGTNDRVRIMRSVDQGRTWTKVVEWNTNGMNQVGHIHAMKQDPYTGEIYVCTGDTDSKSGIIKWDGISSWSDNASLAGITSRRGFTVFSGAQRFRVCDVLFDRNYFYTFTDTQKPNNPDGSESGIWRGRKDFSSFTRVDNQIYDYDPMHVGWFGDKIGDTFIFTTAREYSNPSNAWNEINTQVYVSNDGLNWHRTGSLNWFDNGDVTSGRYAANVFSFNNRFYIDCMQGAGHYSTIQCELAREWRTGDPPVILHPVYFAGNWNSEGNDANTGTTADSPKRSLGNILMNNNISAGARIRVSEGEFIENQINPLWSNPVFRGRGSVVIEGQGKERTTLSWANPNSNNGIVLAGSRTGTGPETPLILKDIGLFMNDRSDNTHNNYILNITDSYIKTISCRFGGIRNEDSPLVNLASERSKYESENSIYITNSSGSPFSNILRTVSDNTFSVFRNCIFLNSHISFYINNRGSDFSLSNCTFYGEGHAGIVFGARCDRPPFIKNCIFSSGDTAIIDYAGLEERNVDYNYYNGRIINVRDGGNSISGNDPSFVDPERGIFNLNSFSPCAMAGVTLPDIIVDYEGKERRNPPSIGAFEDPALYAFPGLITLPAPGQDIELRIVSSGNWTISYHDSWIRISSLSGTESGIISVYAIRNNNSSEPRTGNIVFSDGVNHFTLKIIQLSNPDPDEPGTEFVNLRIFPVPVSGILHIEYGDYRIVSFKVINTAGAVLSWKDAEGLSHDFDFSGYAGGIYVLEFFSEEGNFHRVRIIKN